MSYQRDSVCAKIADVCAEKHFSDVSRTMVEAARIPSTNAIAWANRLRMLTSAVEIQVSQRMCHQVAAKSARAEMGAEGEAIALCHDASAESADRAIDAIEKMITQTIAEGRALPAR